MKNDGRESVTGKKILIFAIMTKPIKDSLKYSCQRCAELLWKEIQNSWRASKKTSIDGEVPIILIWKFNIINIKLFQFGL